MCYIWDNKEDCPMRHENGNCLPMGGFCNALKNELCDALHQAFDRGYILAVKETKKYYNKDNKEIN